MKFINHRHGVRSSTLRLAVLLLAGVASFPAWAAAHFLTLINDDMRTVVEVDAAPAGTATWSPLDIGGPLIGGSSGQATVRFGSAAGCKEDIRVRYADGAPLTIVGFDICRTPTLHLGRARAMGERHAQTGDTDHRG